LDVNIHLGIDMLSQTVEYALRTVVHLAANAPASSTTAELAEATRVPPAYLSKVVQNLARAGILHSQRGSGGGVSFAADAEQLTVLDIVNVVEPIQRIKVCPLGLVTHGKKLCPLHRRLDAALAQMEQAFGATTLAEVLADPSYVKPLCEAQAHRVVKGNRQRT
jgi:Rrf2 family transcriptional regulator, nitric oxide-sensitive transcriptional repressor